MTPKPLKTIQHKTAYVSIAQSKVPGIIVIIQWRNINETPQSHKGGSQKKKKKRKPFFCEVVHLFFH